MEHVCPQAHTYKAPHAHPNLPCCDPPPHTASRTPAGKDEQLVELQQQLRASSQREAAAAKSHKALQAQVERHRQAAEVARSSLATREAALRDMARDANKAGRERQVAGCMHACMCRQRVGKRERTRHTC